MKILQTAYVFLCLWIRVNTVLSQLGVESMRSPWANPTDPAWMIAKAPDRSTNTKYVDALLKQNVASPVFIDKLLMQNGSVAYATVFTNQYLGIATGYNALESEPISMARLKRRVEENRQRNMVPVSPKVNS